MWQHSNWFVNFVNISQVSKSMLQVVKSQQYPVLMYGSKTVVSLELHFHTLSAFKSKVCDLGTCFLVELQ